jgi:hypothetical protein
MKCPQCSAGVLIEIRLAFGDSHFTMRSCSSCETRWWDLDGELVALDRVLSTVAAV